MLNKLKQLSPFFILSFVAIFAYWQLAFFQYSLKWDAIDQFFPIRRFISECLRTGNLPLWCPYSNLGYPVHADPQSGSWYPLGWFFSIFSTYSIYTVSIEYITHIFLAGTGMYLFSRSLNLGQTASIFTGIAYMLSGVFVGNAQHTTWIISATWLPYVFRSFLKLNFEPRLKHILLFALFFFLMMSGGYPAFVIITAYILIISFIIIHWNSLIRLKIKNILFSFRYLISAAIISILLCAVSLVSFFEIMPYFSRGGGIPLEVAQFNPFSPQALISLITPFATIKDYDFFNTDQSMANGYIGIISLVFLLLFIIQQKTKLEWLFFGIAIFCLLASFGDYFFLRAILYKYLPLLDSFRFPSLFRVFFILFSIICCGSALQKFIDDHHKFNKKLLLTAIAIISFTTFLFIYNIKDLSIININIFDKDYYINAYNATTLRQRISFQALLQMFVLAAFIVAIIKIKNIRKLSVALVVFTAVEMTLAAQINTPVSIVTEFSPAAIKKNISALPKGFVVPPAEDVINFNDGGLIQAPLWRNMNFYHKKPAWDGFNNFTLNNYQVFINSPLKEITLQNPLVFLSDKIYSEKEFNKKPITAITPADLFFSPEQYKLIENLNLKNTKGDTAYITAFEANRIVAKSISQHPQMLTLLQCFYQGWQVLIDGKETKIFSPGSTFISALIPAGKHNVEFKYKLKPVVLAFYITAFTFILVVSALIFLLFFSRKNNK